MPQPPIVVVGAGAAGLVAAIFAARTGPRPVVLLEGTPDGGRKILVSGGGRCNVLPAELAPERFVTDSSPNTLRKMLRSWPLAEQREFFEREVGIPLALEAESGKWFPASNRARDVRDGLVALARRSGVELRTGLRVVDLEPGNSGWTVLLAAGPPIDAAAVVLATGGLSLPGTGSDGAGLAIAERLGLRTVPTYPALTPLTGEGHAGLAGVSLPVRIEAPGTGRFAEGGFLFTHRGWSGPAVLDLSDLVARRENDAGRTVGRGTADGAALRVRWCALDEGAWEQALRSGPGTPLGVLRRHLPERLAEQLLAESGVEPGISLAQLPREGRKRLIAHLVRYPLPATGDEGYKKAEVTGGGVELSEVNPRTMECRNLPGLYLCGEILDAFGPIGGHNFSWAWATGRAAGLGAAKFGG